MMNFLKLLIYEIRTVDGNINSADKICNALYKQAFSESKNKDPKIKKIIDSQIMKKTALKYKIIRIRIKISYYAFKHNMSIKELFI